MVEQGPELSDTTTEKLDAEAPVLPVELILPKLLIITNWPLVGGVAAANATPEVNNATARVERKNVRLVASII